jgi:hypothetical protein
MRVFRLSLIALVILDLICPVTSSAAWQRVDSQEEAERYFSKPLTQLVLLAGIKRAQVYWPHALPAAVLHGVPEDIFFGLALCESAFNPFARSSAGAEGMFQFMPATGRIYGLYNRQDRRSVSKSSHASARLLRDLHRRFGCWNLALAAYNSGSGRVQKAIRRAGSKQWSKVKQHLPTQTYSYVPKIRYVAAKQYPQFLTGGIDSSKLRLEKVMPGDTWFQLETEHGVPERVLRRLNGSGLYAGALIVVPEPDFVNALLDEE